LLGVADDHRDRNALLLWRRPYIVRCHCTLVHFERRKTRGKHYLWIVESHRTSRGVRRLWQMYVGTAESLHARLTRSGKVRLKAYPFGKTAALLRAA
jgi:hypothetical protein